MLKTHRHLQTYSAGILVCDVPCHDLDALVDRVEAAYIKPAEEQLLTIHECAIPTCLVRCVVKGRDCELCTQG